MLPLVAAPWGVAWPLPPLLAVPFPNLLTELVHGVQVGVVDELHEVSVPDLLAGGHAVGHLFGLGLVPVVVPVQELFQVLRVDDLQRHLEQSLHEPVLHGEAQVGARVLALQAAQQQALLGPDGVVVHSDLLFPVLIPPLELPVHQRALGLGAALQESTAVLHAVDDPFLQAVPEGSIVVLEV